MQGKREAVLALGMFDGMHIGHRTLIGRAVERSKELGCEAAVYTFSNHPMSILGGRPRMLSTPGEREADMRALGVTDVCMEPFTAALAGCPPERFVASLCERWRVRAFTVGFNYTFGARGLGTPELLERLGRERGFEVAVVEPVLYRNAPVSSSRIRGLVEQGDMLSAAQMLTHPYTLVGTVVENRRIGRKIGFPTANIALDPSRVTPKNGVYATVATLGGKTYRAVTNVGTNPTVAGDHLSIETHLLGFEGDAYGKTLCVAFVDFLRDERRFDSVEALKSQIAQDVERAKGRALER